MTNQINQIASPSLSLSMMIAEAVYQAVVRVERLARFIATRAG